MELKEFTRLLSANILEGVEKALAQNNRLPVAYSKAEAYRLFGRSDVDRWINEGLITPVLSGAKVSKKCIDRIQLERVAAASNRITYLPVADR